MRRCMGRRRTRSSSEHRGMALPCHGNVMCAGATSMLQWLCDKRMLLQS
jgi:hypothetical protein